MFGNSFEILGVKTHISQVLIQSGWKEPTPIQSKVIPCILHRKHVIALSETGSGKTGAFAIPIVHRFTDKPTQNLALILTPTHELADQVSEVIKNIAKPTKIKVLVLVGNEDINEQKKTLKNERFHIIVGTPGRIAKILRTSDVLMLSKTRYFVIDEADRMLSDDLQTDMDTIIESLPKGDNLHISAFSATMTNNLEKLQRLHMIDPARIRIDTGNIFPQQLNQKLTLLKDPKDKLPFLFAILLDNMRVGNCLVFFNSKFNVRKLFQLCEMHGELTGLTKMLHGDLTRSQRQLNMQRFTDPSKNCRILLATDAACRGLDLADVRLVVNYDVPMSKDSYQHRVGRTARGGNTGTAINLVCWDSLPRFYTKVDAEFQVDMPCMKVETQIKEKEAWAKQREELSKKLADITTELRQQDKELEKNLKDRKRRHGKESGSSNDDNSDEGRSRK